jgi:hypothetical protein
MCQGTDTVLKTKLFGLKEIHGVGSFDHFSN